MSLLLDALKKAEEAKRQSADARPAETAEPQLAPPAELSLDPLHAPPPPTQLPDLSAHLDTVDADLAAVPTTAPPRRAVPAAETPSPQHAAPAGKVPETATDREAIRNVFAAKHTPPPDRKPLWITLTVAGIGAVGIGGWFWWQLQSVGAGSLGPRPSGAAPAPAASAASAPPPAVPTTPPPVAAPAPSTFPAIEPAPAPVAPPARTEPPPQRASAEPEGPVRISRGEQRVNPALTQAYDHLQADNLEAAAKAYEQVLRSDPHNTDALLGLGVIALRAGQPARADDYFTRVLEVDPKNATALAALINLRGQNDPGLAESRLKGLLAAQPDSPGLNAALGNLYAAQARWAEAQQAYFKAYTTDSGNPDYIYNLAAALDHLHQPRLALQYYQTALTAAGSRRAGFNRDEVNARILELQR